MNLKIYTKRK